MREIQMKKIHNISVAFSKKIWIKVHRNPMIIPLSQLAEQISYVSQDNYLFNRSIRENIRMGKPSASDNPRGCFLWRNVRTPEGRYPVNWFSVP